MHWIFKFWETQSKILIGVLHSYSGEERQSFSYLWRTCFWWICLVSTEWLTASLQVFTPGSKKLSNSSHFQMGKNSLQIIIFLQSEKKKTFQEGHRTLKAILTLIDFHEIKYMKPHFLHCLWFDDNMNSNAHSHTHTHAHTVNYMLFQDFH